MFTQRPFGKTICVVSMGNGHTVCWINARGDSDKGIPCKQDRAIAKLIVDALNEYERTHFNEVVDAFNPK